MCLQEDDRAAHAAEVALLSLAVSHAIGLRGEEEAKVQSAVAAHWETQQRLQAANLQVQQLHAQLEMQSTQLHGVVTNWPLIHPCSGNHRK